MASDEIVVIRVERIDVSDGGKWSVNVGTKQYGQQSTTSIYPRFKNRSMANRVGAYLADIYTSEGWVVEFTRARLQKPGKVVKP